VFLTAPLQNAHAVLEAGESPLAADTASAAGSLVVMDSSKFPTTGFPYSIIVGRGTPEEEVLVVTANTTATNTLTLDAPTTIDHRGPVVQFLRKALQADAPLGRTFILLDSNDTRVFPADGYVRIGGTNTVKYVENDIENDVLVLKRPLAVAGTAGDSVELVIPGITVETVSVIQTGIDWSIHETEPRKIKVFIPGNEEGYRLLDASYLHGETPAPASSTLAVATVAADVVLTLADTSGFPETGVVLINGTTTRFYAIKDDGANTMILTQAVGGVFGIGDAVDLQLVNYAGTDLDEGNLHTSGGALEVNQFPGPYVYDQVSYAPSLSPQSTLDETIPPPTRVAADQLAGRTNLEVEDAGLFPAPPFTPFDVRLGRGSGDQEDRTLTDRTLKTDAATTVDSPIGVGSSTLPGVDTTDFPESDGLHQAGYRIIIDQGGVAEEIVMVAQNATGTPGTFTLVGTTINAHAATETIELLNDVLTFDELQEPHDGPTTMPTALGDRVEKLVTGLTVAVGTGVNFPSAGVIYVNFGKGRINVRQRIKTVVSTTILEFVDTSIFPTTDFPYRIKVGEGLPQEEYALVTANDTGLNRLTLSAALVGTFAVGNYVEFKAGVPDTFTYTDRDGDFLEFETPRVVESLYTEGENVMISSGFSIPSQLGTDYAFLLPPTARACLDVLFALVRAAGVEVVFLTDR
jgi:hypothetical protein